MVLFDPGDRMYGDPEPVQRAPDDAVNEINAWLLHQELMTGRIAERLHLSHRLAAEGCTKASLHRLMTYCRAQRKVESPKGLLKQILDQPQQWKAYISDLDEIAVKKNVGTSDGQVVCPHGRPPMEHCCSCATEGNPERVGIRDCCDPEYFAERVREAKRRRRENGKCKLAFVRDEEKAERIQQAKMVVDYQQRCKNPPELDGCPF